MLIIFLELVITSSIITTSISAVTTRATTKLVVLVLFEPALLLILFIFTSSFKILSRVCHFQLILFAIVLATTSATTLPVLGSSSVVVISAILVLIGFGILLLKAFQLGIVLLGLDVTVADEELGRFLKEDSVTAAFLDTLAPIEHEIAPKLDCLFFALNREQDTVLVLLVPWAMCHRANVPSIVIKQGKCNLVVERLRTKNHQFLVHGVIIVFILAKLHFKFMALLSRFFKFKDSHEEVWVSLVKLSIV